MSETLNAILPAAAAGGRNIVSALLLAGALSGGGLMAGSTNAGAAPYPMTVTTTGTITSGSETGGVFGLPTATTSLIGDAYSLSVTFDEPGPNYNTDGSGTFASDFESFPGISGYVAATVNGNTVSVNLSSGLSSSLFEDLFDMAATNQGFDAAGNFVDVSQTLNCGGACVPYADLMTSFQYALQSGDFGQDIYTYEAAGFPALGTPTATFTGTETNMTFAPEPDSWTLLATGLLGLGLLVRLRRA